MSTLRTTTEDGQRVTAATMRQLRAAVRRAMQKRTIHQAAVFAGCSRKTLYRILRGDNVTFETVSRIVDGLGCQLEIRVTEKHDQN